MGMMIVMPLLMMMMMMMHPHGVFVSYSIVVEFVDAAATADLPKLVTRSRLFELFFLLEDAAKRVVKLLRY